ncbi:MAG TPA: NUDIX domain-containing protein [Longimicrobium sp.]|nr:NUDIX domain-containing protein [Longimicrobium sp.]
MSDSLSRDRQPPQSAALPYRVRDGRVEVLLITPRGGDGWIIPKGKVEARLGPRESARREAEEEGGVQGEVDRAPFGQYRHGSREGGPLVTVFLMRVAREMASWAEAHERERRWAGLDDVPGLVVDPGLATLMRTAGEHLANHAPAAWLAAEESRLRARGRRRRIVGSTLVLAAALGAAVIAFFAA